MPPAGVSPPYRPLSPGPRSGSALLCSSLCRLSRPLTSPPPPPFSGCPPSSACLRLLLAPDSSARRGEFSRAACRRASRGSPSSHCPAGGAAPPHRAQPRAKLSQCRLFKTPSHQSRLPSRGHPSRRACDNPRRSLRPPLALGLSLLTWNARSLICHQADFLHLLQDQDIGVAAVQECHGGRVSSGKNRTFRTLSVLQDENGTSQ